MAGDRGPLAGAPRLSRTARKTLVLLGFLVAAQAGAVITQAASLAAAISSIASGTAADGPSWALWLSVAGGAIAARAGLSWTVQVVARRGAAGTKAELRRRALDAVLARPGSEPVGGTANLLTAGLDDLDDWFTGYVPALLSAAVVPATVIACLVWVDWLSALIVCLTLPLVPIFMILVGRFTQRRTADAMDALTRLADHVVELASGLPVLIGLGRAAEYGTALAKISERHRGRTLETLRIAFLSALVLELLSTLSVAVVAVTIGLRLIGGGLDLAAGLLAIILAPECFLPLRTLGAAYHSSTAGLEALRRTGELMARPSDRGNLREVREYEVPAEWGARHLTVTWPDRSEPTIDDIAFTVRRGEIVGITGPSGCGKSTLLALLADARESADATTSGTVTRFDSALVAYAAQQPRTTEDTVADEVALAAAGEVSTALTQLGLESLANRHPAELSPGERQRLALARVLVRVRAGASVVLLDEPTAHLDEHSTALVRTAILGLRGRATVVFTSHREDVLALADRRWQWGSEGLAPENAAGSRGAALVPNSEESHDQAHRAESPNGSCSSVQPTPHTRRTAVWAARTLRADGWRLACVVLLGALALAAGIALTGTSAWLIARAAEHPPVLTLMVAIVGVRFFGLTRAVMRYAERLRGHDAVLRIAAKTRSRLWEALVAYGPTRVRKLRDGTSLAHLVGDIDLLTTGLLRVVLPPLATVLVLIGALVGLGAMLPAAWWLAVPLVATAVLVPLAAGWADRRASARTVDLRRRLARQVTVGLSAGPDLRAHGLQRRVGARITALDAALVTADRRVAWADGLATGILVAGCGAASVLGLVLGSAAAASGQLTPIAVGVLALVPLALAEVCQPLIVAAREAPGLWSAVVRSRALLDGAPVSAEAIRQVSAKGPTVITSLRLRGIVARWPGQDDWKLGPVDADVHTGQWLGVVGPSGSGKSTLLAVLLGFLRPIEGQYTLSDVDTRTLDAERVRERITWCPQEAMLFSSTLRRNLTMATPVERPIDDAELRDVLRRVGLGSLLARLRDGLDTWVGPGGLTLSGGERRRVAVARALLRPAEVVLLDEPTAHLDQAAADALMVDLRHALADRIVVMVTHDARYAVTCDRLVSTGQHSPVAA